MKYLLFVFCLFWSYAGICQNYCEEMASLHIEKQFDESKDSFEHSYKTLMSYGRKDSIYRDLLNTPINWKEWAIVPVLKVSPKVNSKNKHGFTIDTTSQAIFYNSIQKVAYVYDVYSPDRIDPVRVNPELAMLFKKEASSRFIAYLLGMEMPMYSVYGYCSAGQTYYFTDAANSSKTLSVFIEKQFGSVAKYCERFQDQITEKEIRDSIKRSRGSKEYGLLLQDWNLVSLRPTTPY